MAALAAWDELARWSESKGLVSLQARALRAAGAFARQAGQLNVAIERFRAAAELAERWQLAGGTAAALRYMATVEIERNRVRVASDLLRQVGRMARQAGDRRLALYAAQNSAELLAKQGRYRASLQVLLSVADVAAQDVPAMRATYLGNLGWFAFGAIAAGQVSEGRAVVSSLLLTAAQEFAAVGRRDRQANVFTNLGYWRLHQGDVAGARPALER